MEQLLLILNHGTPGTVTPGTPGTPTPGTPGTVTPTPTQELREPWEPKNGN